MKEIVIDLFARHPELRDRHGIGERTAQACRELLIAHGRALAEIPMMDPTRIPDRQPRDYDDLRPGRLVMPDDFEDEDEPSEDIFEESDDE